MRALTKTRVAVADVRRLLALGRVFRRIRRSIRRLFINYWTVFIAVRLLPRRTDLVLHLGCGECRIPGAINIDRQEHAAVDLLCDVTRLPYRKGSVARIETYHLVEHLPRAGLETVLSHWRSLLCQGGTLVVECPDFDRAVRDYLEGNEARLGNIFGLQRFSGDFHHWGWTSSRLTRLLLEVGFAEVEEKPPQDYHTEIEPCLRLEAHNGNAHAS
jgi:hypothetical protein